MTPDPQYPGSYSILTFSLPCTATLDHCLCLSFSLHVLSTSGWFGWKFGTDWHQVIVWVISDDSSPDETGTRRTTLCTS